MAQGRRSASWAIWTLAAVLVVAVLARNVVKPSASTLAGAADVAAAEEQDASAASDVTGEEAQAPIYLADHDATVYTELGEPLRLSDIADGRPLVINFWATWCPYCIQEMPDFQEIWRDYGDRVAFAFIDSTDGSRETKDSARAWLEQNGLELPAYYDEDLEATTSFGVWALPMTVVVAADGEILTVSAGAIDPTLLRGALGTLV